MKFRLISILLVLILSVIAVSVVAAHGNTHTQDQLENAGWDCGPPFPPGHCRPPGMGERASTQTIQVKVFDEAGHFLGNEILWHVDIYAGQMCPQDQLLTPDDIGIPYYACHRYPEVTAGG